MSAHNLGLFTLCTLLSSTGCFASHSTDTDSCEARRPCLEVDSLGCCDDGSVTLHSVCEMCPAGTVEDGACRRAGCEMPPVCDTPLFCLQDLGAGCCGSPVSNTSCDACPTGSVTQDRCAAYQPECGCAEIRPLVPPLCVRDLGDGCCDLEDFQEVSVCGCRDGYIQNYECRDSIGGGPRECAEEYGEGCCGPAIPSACGECPGGTVPLAECTFVDDDGVPDYRCLEDLGGGLCGCDVTVCGTCPPGSVLEDECRAIDCLMP